MLIIRRGNKSMEIQKNTLVSFYNSVEDLLCIFMVQLTDHIYGSCYVFNKKALPENVDYKNGEEMIKLIQTGNPFLLLSFSNNFDDYETGTIEDTEDILNSLNFDLNIELNKEAPKFYN